MQHHDPDPVDDEARQGCPREAQQRGVDPRGVLQRAEVGGGVAGLVDGRDLDLLDRHPQLVGSQQGRELVLVPIAGDLQQPVQLARRVAAQAGLGVAQPPPRRSAEQQCGDAVAQSASQGHRTGEGSHAQRHATGLVDPAGHRGDVGGCVLAVGVGAHDVGARPQADHPRQTGAQGPALARIDRVAGDHRSGGAGRGEDALVGGAGAVVDDEHPRLRKRAPHVPHQAGQAHVRLVGGDEDDERDDAVSRRGRASGVAMRLRGREARDGRAVATGSALGAVTSRLSAVTA